ncbi:MAG: tRNA lysidine(34) synthetase TilS [Desulfonatronovibrio sp.]
MRLKLQNLPPAWARFCLGIQSFMERLAGESIKDRKLLVAFSGGADSTALLRVMDIIRIRSGINISAVHLNHMLRPGAHADEEFSRGLCSDLDIPITCGRSNVSAYARIKKTGLEEAARTVRYNFILALAARQKADYILTGHHLNDLAEDVIMRLGRGTGWPGLSGMTGFDPARKLVRPFLLTPRQKILDFLSVLGQEYMCDSSNEDVSFSRNKIRHEVLPVLEEVNPGILKSVAGLWELGRIDGDYWQEFLKNIDVPTRDGGKYVSRGMLEPLPRAARLRLYKKVLDELGPGQALFDNLNDLDQLWKQNAGNKAIQFPGNKLGTILKKGIMFRIAG